MNSCVSKIEIVHSINVKSMSYIIKMFTLFLLMIDKYIVLGRFWVSIASDYINCSKKAKGINIPCEGYSWKTTSNIEGRDV